MNNRRRPRAQLLRKAWRMARMRASPSRAKMLVPTDTWQAAMWAQRSGSMSSSGTSSKRRATSSR
eukprot:2800397-Pyramimonas_sp.AAC.1